MRRFFYKLGRNIAECFSGYNLLLHLLAILLTYAFVISGFDWAYFIFFRDTLLYRILFPAAIIGGLTPILLPIAMYIFGWFKKNLKISKTAFALGEAAIIGWGISSFYKAFTGRAHPDLVHNSPIVDISRQFKFGLLRGGVFWGWPSSHATIAFAMAVALLTLYPRSKLLKYLSLLYAFYVGIGVSMSIHWFSDFIAGALLGVVIGVVVGRSFRAGYAIKAS